MFVGRNEDGSISGRSATSRPWTTEELPDDHPDILAFEQKATRHVGRREDGSIFGTSSIPQDWTTEELLEDHPDVVTFTNRPMPEPASSG